MSACLSPAFFDFYQNLAINNHKTWFDAHRAEYLSVVKEPFEQLVSELQFAFKEVDEALPIFKPSDLIFRINRDIRFAKDKTPYKTFSGVYFSWEGKKTQLAGFYIQVGATETFVGGGAYELRNTQVLASIRAAIAENPEAWLALVESPTFKEMYQELKGERAKVIPKEYKALAPNLPYLYFKQFWAAAHLQPEQFCAPDIVSTLVKYYQGIAPLNQFLNQYLRSN